MSRVASRVTVSASASVPNSLFVVNSGSTVSISSGQTLTVGDGVANGIISGSGALAESGAGNTLTLTAHNTYSGGTTISGGTLSVANVGSGTNTQNIGNGPITFASGGTLLDTGSAAAQLFTGAVAFGSGGGVINMTGGGTIWLNATITGGGGLITGGNDLILEPSGNNNIGPITNFSGRLFVFTTGAIGSTPSTESVVTEESGATLDFSLGTSFTPPNTITFEPGSAVSSRGGPGSILTLNTANVTFPSAGTMTFDQDDQASYNITVSGTYPTLTGPLIIQVGGPNPPDNATIGTVTMSATISGSGSLTKTQNGTLILNSADSYTGGTTVSASAGNVTAEVSGSLGSGPVSIASGATMTLANGTSDTVSGLTLNGASEPLGNLWWNRLGCQPYQYHLLHHSRPGC